MKNIVCNNEINIFCICILIYFIIIFERDKANETYNSKVLREDKEMLRIY